MKTFNRFAALFFVLAFASVLGCTSSTNDGKKASYMDDSVVTTRVKSAILA